MQQSVISYHRYKHATSEVLGLILAKKDNIDGLGPVPLRGCDRSHWGVGTVWLGPVTLRCWDQSRQRKIILRVGTGSAEGFGRVWLGPVLLRCWDQSRRRKIKLRGWDRSCWGVGTSHAKGLRPNPIRGWDWSHWRVGSSPAEVLGLIPAKKDHIEELGPVSLRGWDRSGWVLSRWGVGIDPGEERSYWWVGTGLAEGLGPLRFGLVPLRWWDQSRRRKIILPENSNLKDVLKK